VLPAEPHGEVDRYAGSNSEHLSPSECEEAHIGIVEDGGRTVSGARQFDSSGRRFGTLLRRRDKQRRRLGDSKAGWR
jgi:hypothetical protein